MRSITASAPRAECGCALTPSRAVSCCIMLSAQVRRSTYHDVLKLDEATGLLQIKGEVELMPVFARMR